MNEGGWWEINEGFDVICDWKKNQFKVPDVSGGNEW